MRVAASPASRVRVHFGVVRVVSTVRAGPPTARLAAYWWRHLSNGYAVGVATVCLEVQGQLCAVLPVAEEPLERHGCEQGSCSAPPSSECRGGGAEALSPSSRTLQYSAVRWIGLE